jgi:hypothetical protein
LDQVCREVIRLGFGKPWLNHPLKTADDSTIVIIVLGFKLNEFF